MNKTNTLLGIGSTFLLVVFIRAMEGFWTVLPFLFLILGFAVLAVYEEFSR